MKLKNVERKIKEYNQSLVNFEEQFVIIPYLASGYIDYSNFGQVDGQRQINNYETYKRLWTGNDSFTITWKDSVIFTNTQEDNNIKVNYQIGDAILGWMENSSNVVEIQQDNSFSEYKSQFSENNFIFRINANEFSLDDNWEFMFFKIPEISKNVLFRVASLEKEYLGRDLMCYVLTLKSLNQELSNTGRAKQQNVMPNSPGQGYYDVSIVEEYTPNPQEKEGIDYKKFYNRWLVADKSKMFNNPVKKVVVKAFGMCGFSNITFWGRKARAGDDFRNFGVPRIIFPMNLTNASTYTLYRTQNEETNYYWCEKLLPTVAFSKDTFDAIKSFVNLFSIWPSQGFITIETHDNVGKTSNFTDTIANLKKTNPIDDKHGDIYTYQLFGSAKSTGSGTTTFAPWTFKITGDGKTTGLLKTDISYGCAQYYNVSGTKTIHDAMFDAYWTQKQIKTLPVKPQNTLNFGWTIGAAYAAGVARNFYTSAAMLLIGVYGAWMQKRMAPNFQGFACMVPASLMDFMIDECGGSMGIGFNRNVKLSYFDSDDRDNMVKQLFNTATLNTSFEADLTDKIRSSQGAFETTYIGQTTREDGANVLPSGKPLLMDGTYSLQELTDENEGFIIDSFNIQALFKGDYSVEFLDKQGSVVWSGVFQSQGKWTDSIREINTWVNTSIYGRENMFLSEPLKWPKPPAELNLIGLPEPVIDISFADREIGTVVEITENNAPKSNSFETIFFSPNFFNWRYVNSADSLVTCDLETNPPGKYSLKGEHSRILIKSNWQSTLQDFFDKYDTVEATVATLAPEGVVDEDKPLVFKITPNEEREYAFGRNYEPNTQHPIKMNVYIPQQTGGSSIVVNFGFRCFTNWYAYFSFELVDNNIYMKFRYVPRYWTFELVSYRYNRPDYLRYEEWKNYNSLRAFTYFNNQTKISFGIYLKRIVIQPKNK